MILITMIGDFDFISGVVTEHPVFSGLNIPFDADKELRSEMIFSLSSWILVFRRRSS